MNNSYPPWTQTLRHLTVGVFESMSPCDIRTGVVINDNPLEISLGADFVLTRPFLELTNAVKDHKVDISVSWSTEEESEHVHGNGNGGDDTTASKEPHKHDIKGLKTITIHNGLTKGEKVLLLREQGGQNYIVLDRISEIITKGEGSK